MKNRKLVKIVRALTSEYAQKIKKNDPPKVLLAVLESALIERHLLLRREKRSILHNLRRIMSSEKGQAVFGDDELTDDRIFSKLTCCVVHYIKCNTAKVAASEGFELPATELGWTYTNSIKGSSSSSSDPGFVIRTWKVSYNGQPVGNIGFAQNAGQMGQCNFYHFGLGMEGGNGDSLDSLQDALAELVAVHSDFLRDDVAFKLPAGFTFERIDRSRHAYLIKRRGHVVGEVNYDQSQASHQSGAWTFIGYRSDAVEENLATAQEAADRLIEAHRQVMGN